jgi:aminoglycoside 3-N-acetyltransferase
MNSRLDSNDGGEAFAPIPSTMAPQERTTSASLVTRDDIVRDLRRLGIRPGDCLMVHSSLARIGRVLGGAPEVVRALLESVGDHGTLVMPAFSPEVSDPAGWADTIPPAELARARASVPAFDADTTPTTMGLIPETFRRWPGVLRGAHPQVSVCARGPLAATLVDPHPLSWGQGAGSPFERLVRQDARLLLLGVGFNRATLLHFAESTLPNRRTKIRRIPLDSERGRRWIEVPDVGNDLDTHFPAIGDEFVAAGRARMGLVGSARSILCASADLVAFAAEYLDRALPAVG